MVAEDPYVYPGTRTLRNRYGVRDPRKLAVLEAEVSYARLIELAARPLPGAYDLAHLQRFHRHIFGDVYEWAGEIRTVAIAKGDMFALPAYVQSYLEGVLEQLPGENHLRGLQRDRFVDRLAHYLAEINAAHPFRDGNGRAHRAFVGQLADDAGFAINWARLDPERNIEVSVAAHRGSNRPLRAMLAELVSERELDQVKDLGAAALPLAASRATKPGSPPRLAPPRVTRRSARGRKP